MNKFKFFVLTACLLFSASFSQANNNSVTSTDGIPIEVIENAHHGHPEKSNSIYASIDGHYLTVSFMENIGQVTIEVTTSTGAPVDYLSIQTPNGYMYYIPNTGDYVVTFTLSNGDEYYGEFTVTE